MGNFYTSYSLRFDSQDVVLESLAGTAAFVSTAPGPVTVVLDEASEEQEFDVLSTTGAELSAKFRCPVLAVLNHDDSVLWFELYEDGVRTDAYNSAPSYFDDSADALAPTGGDAQHLVDVFGVGSASEIERILRDAECVFEFERHRELVQALGIPLWSVVGYQSIRDGESPDWVTAGTFVHTAPG